MSCQRKTRIFGGTLVRQISSRHGDERLGRTSDRRRGWRQPGAAAVVRPWRRPVLSSRQQGKFWVLSGSDVYEGAAVSASDDSEEEGEDSDLEALRRRRPAASTLGGFILRAHELGGSLQAARRSSFAPGGKGSRFRGSVPPATP
jgi:hypothetical protein